MKKEFLPTKKLLKTKDILRCREDSFLVAMLTKGNMDVKIENRLFPLKEGELIVFKPGKKAALLPHDPCEITTIIISRNRLKTLSAENFDFEEKLNYVPYDVAIVHIDVKEYLILKNILNRLISIETDEFRFGLELYEINLLASFLILLLRACIKSDQIHKQNNRKTLIIDDVFLYVQKNIGEDLSLRQLEEMFHVSAEHLSRRFKDATGIGIHDYIIKSRIDLSCRYLLEGENIAKICTLAGFKSYNHFFRVFKKSTGFTPKQYLANYKNNPLEKRKKTDSD